MRNYYNAEAETQGTRAPLAPHEDAPGLRPYTLVALLVVLVLDVVYVQLFKKTLHRREPIVGQRNSKQRPLHIVGLT